MEDEPQVRERGYFWDSAGPDEDTGTFYRRTPGPAQRTDYRKPAAPPSRASTPTWMPRRRSPRAEEAQAPSSGVGPMVGRLIGAAAVFATLVTGVVVGLWMGGVF